jgi:hypothetical protein
LKNRENSKPFKIELVFMKHGAKLVVAGLLFIVYVFILGLVILDNNSSTLKLLLSFGFIYIVKSMWPRP